MEIVQFLFSFKQTYNNRSNANGALAYFCENLEEHLKPKTTDKNSYEDINQLQEIIVQKFIMQKLMIILIRVIMDHNLCYNPKGWDLLETVMDILMLLCQAQLPSVTKKLVELKFVSILLFICDS